MALKDKTALTSDIIQDIKDNAGTSLTKTRGIKLRQRLLDLVDSLVQITEFDNLFEPTILGKKQIAVSNVLGLLSGGKIDVSLIPDSVIGAIEYQGVWNASTNNPTIPTASLSNNGYYYKVSVAGSTNINGIADWNIGDWIISNGTSWDRIGASDVIIVDASESEKGISLLANQTDAENVDNATITNINHTKSLTVRGFRWAMDRLLSVFKFVFGVAPRINTSEGSRIQWTNSTKDIADATVRNGISLDASGNLELGGELTKITNIDGTSDKQLYFTINNGSNRTRLQLANDQFLVSKLKDGLFTNFELNEGIIQLQDDVLGKIQFDRATLKVFFRDERIVKKGIEYDADYSAGFTSRSLVDKAYVDGIASNPNIANDSITNAKLANMANATIKGRSTAGIGDPEDLTTAQVKALLALVKADVGLGNVDNTSDANKPISTATQTALNLKQNTSEKNANNGYAGLDTNGKLFWGQIPNAVQVADFATWGYDFTKDSFIVASYSGNFTAPNFVGARRWAMCFIKHNSATKPNFTSDYVKSYGYNYNTNQDNYLTLLYNPLLNKVVVYSEQFDFGIATAISIIKPYFTPYVFASNLLEAEVSVADTPTITWKKSNNSGGSSPVDLATSLTYTVIGNEVFVGFGVSDFNDGFYTEQDALDVFLQAKATEDCTFAPTGSPTNATRLEKSNADGFTGTYQEYTANASGALSIRGNFGGGSGNAGFQSGFDYEIVVRVKATGITGGSPKIYRTSGSFDNLFYPDKTSTAQPAQWTTLTAMDTIFELKVVVNDSGATNQTINVGWEGGTITSGSSKLFVQIVSIKKIV